MFDSKGQFVQGVELYNVLLIDDERNVREAIKESVNWNSLGIDMVQEAENGIEGLEQFFQCIPDIIFLDIQMPRMDGIEFATIIRKRFPQIRIVILSGYDLFEYAQSALRIGVHDYVLKPFLKERIPQIVKAQLTALKAEASTTQNTAFTNSVLQLRKEIARRLQQGVRVDAQTLDECYGSFIKERGERCYYLNLNWHSTSSDAGQFSASTDFAIASIAENLLLSEQSGFTFEAAGGSQAAVFWGTDAQLRQAIDIIRIQFSKMTDSSAFISVSGPGRIEELNTLRLQALEAECKCFLCTNPMVTCYEDLQKQNTTFEYPADAESLLLSKCFYTAPEELIPLVGDFFSRILESYIDSNTCKYVLLRLLTKLSCCIDSFNTLNYSNEWFDNFDPLEVLQNFHSVHDAQPWIMELLGREWQFYDQAVRQCTDTFRQIRSYIHSNYADETLNLKKCSNDLYLSYSYISRVLKKEVNRTFVEYLNDFRVQNAKRLLIETQLPVTRISESVGFTNSSYFSTVFRKYTGMAPQQYRQRGQQ